MLLASTEKAEAVVFFDHGHISREMLFSEFEAILDSVVPMPEFAHQTARAVYIRIDSKLHITAAVFFKIPFDAEGVADRRWNIPLQQLADGAARGPELGSGPILLSCHSQCSIDWQRKSLWNPSMTPASNSFTQLRKAVAGNRLSLVFEVDEDAQQAANIQQNIDTRGIQQQLSVHYKQQFEQEFRNRMANLLKEQRLRITTLTDHSKDVVQKLQREHQNRLEEYRQLISEQKQLLAGSERRHAKLKETVEGQAVKIAGLREYFQHKLQAAETGEAEQLQSLQDSLQENYDLEMEAKIEASTTELKELLEMRDFELVYRHEQESSLREEIAQLRLDNQSLIGNGSDELLQKLDQSGLSFVAFHPGVGHLTIPVEDVSVYLQSPADYAANKAGVTPTHYQQWLLHYQKPVCAALKTGGDLCGASIDRIMQPSEFHVGEKDRCKEHQTSSSQLFAVVG